jgi:sugar phosphate isomerase/epimerase
MRQLGFHTSLFCDISINKTANIIADLGFSAIELNMETSPDFSAHVTSDVTRIQRRAISEAICTAGLTLSSLSAHCNMIEVDVQKRQLAERFVLDAIDLAADLGTDIVHLISGTMRDQVSENQYWQWMAQAVRRAVEYGRNCGVRVAIEAAVFPGFLVWNQASVIQLLERVACDDLYVNFDPSHYLVAGDDVVSTFKTLRPHIIHMHAKDATGERCKFEFPALGDGNVDWLGLVQAITDTRYDGCVSVEYEAHIFATGYDNDPFRAARNSSVFLHDAFGKWLKGTNQYAE